MYGDSSNSISSEYSTRKKHPIKSSGLDNRSTRDNNTHRLHEPEMTVSILKEGLREGAEKSVSSIHQHREGKLILLTIMHELSASLKDFSPNQLPKRVIVEIRMLLHISDEIHKIIHDEVDQSCYSSFGSMVLVQKNKR